MSDIDKLLKIIEESERENVVDFSRNSKGQGNDQIIEYTRKMNEKAQELKNSDDNDEQLELAEEVERMKNNLFNITKKNF